MRAIGLLLAVMACSALLAGIIVGLLAKQGTIPLWDSWATWIPANAHARFLADLAAHNASYLIGGVGGMKDAHDHHTYREADTFHACPQLLGHKKLSECSNSMMSDATEFVFLAGKIAKASELLAMYKAGRVTGLPDGMSTEQTNISLRQLHLTSLACQVSPALPKMGSDPFFMEKDVAHGKRGHRENPQRRRTTASGLTT